MWRAARPVAWFSPLAVLVVTIVAVPVRMLETEGLPRYRALKQELTELREGNAGLAEQVRDLERRASALRDDPAAIAKVAREELGFIEAGEVVFEFAE